LYGELADLVGEAVSFARGDARILDDRPIAADRQVVSQERGDARPGRRVVEDVAAHPTEPSRQRRRPVLQGKGGALLRLARDAERSERAIVEVEDQRIDRLRVGRGEEAAARLEDPGQFANPAVQVVEVV
jgi:hypothetical protein